MTQIVDHDIAKRLVCKPALRPVLDCDFRGGIDLMSHIHYGYEPPRDELHYDMREDDHCVWITWLVFHRQDSTHEGDTESAILVFPKCGKSILPHSPFATYILTRAHNNWHIYENPRWFDGRYHLVIGSGKHPITLKTKEYQHTNRKRLIYYDYVPINMNDADFLAKRPVYSTWFDRWGVDWPDTMTDQRVKDGAAYPHGPVENPMLFIEKARDKRCGVDFE